MAWKKYFTLVDTSGQMSPVNGSVNADSRANPTHRNYSSYLPDVYSGHPNRLERYGQYDTMDSDSEVNAALDILAEFCSQTNEDSGTPFRIFFKEKATGTETKIIKKFMQQWTKLNKFDKRIFKIVRNTFKFGDCFFVRDFKTVFDPYDLMRSLDIKGAHTKHILPVYQRKLEEIEEAIKGKDEQLVEGYSFLSKKELKEYASLLKRIIEDCGRIAHTAKLTRAPRKKKVKPVDKVIEKLQFKKEDNEYKAASINPTDIIGASQLWVFNTKTRNLGCYNATDVGGLNIKGTTLTNFNEETSVQKTIRKPEVVLPATLKAGKVALRKVLTDINAVEQALTGRINSDIILLRVIK